MVGRGRIAKISAALAALVLAGGGPAGAQPRSDIYNEPANCIHTDRQSRFVPPAPGASYEVRMRPGVSNQAGARVQADLIARDVQARLRAGLATNPLGFPDRRVPIFLLPGRFDQDKSEGVTAPACSDRSVPAIGVRADRSRADRASTAAHELFHAYSQAVPPTSGRPVSTWWEEAAATWWEHEAGFPDNPQLDNRWMQGPELPLDNRAIDHEYAMWRYVQWLDTRGLVQGGGGAWPLHREVISGYGAGASRALAQALEARGTSLTDELASFWGDRLKNRATHGPPLRADPRRTLRIRPGNETVKTRAKPLATSFTTFKLADSVRRVEFEFEPRGPTPGQFWGAPERDASQRFFTGETIAFCVGPSVSERKWPTRGFPITFTNGRSDGDVLRSEIDVFAQRDAEQCQGPSGNRACQALARADVAGLFGSGQFPFFSQGERLWRCVFVNREETREVDLIIRRAAPNVDLRQLRRRLRRALAEGGFTAIPEGDVAGIQSNAVEGTTIHTVLMLVGRELNAINLYNGSVAEARNLAGRIAGSEN